MTSRSDFAAPRVALGRSMTHAHTIRPMRALARPQWLASACIAVLVAAGWSYLGLVLAGMSGVTFLEALCRPGLGATGSDAAQAALVFAMWCAMALADRGA